MIQIRWFSLFFIALFILNNALPAQTHLLDSLQKEVDQHRPDDEEKVKLLTQLGFAYRTISPAETRRVAQEVRTLSQKIGYEKGLGLSDQLIGISYSLQGNYTEALKSFLLALDTFRNIDDSIAIGKQLSNIAGIYYNLGDFEQAEEYSAEAYKIVSRHQPDNAEGIATTALGLGIIEVQLGKYDKALERYHQAKKTFQKGKNEQRLSVVLSSIGNLYKAQKDYSRAMYYYQESLEIKERIGDKIGQAVGMLQIARLYVQQGRNEKAESILEEISKLARDEGLNHMMVEIYDTYMEISLERGDYKSAFQYQELYMKYKDSISIETESKTLANLELAYSIERNRQKTELLEKDRELSRALIEKKEATIKNQKILNAAITIVALFLLLFAVNLFVNRRKIKQSNAILLQKQEENEAKQIELEELNETKDKWFALMCHDFKQPLSFMVGALELLNDKKSSLTAQEQKMLLTEMEDRSKNCSSMLDNLLYWAQDQQNGIVVRKERLDMEAIFSENLFLQDSALRKKSLTVQLEMKERSFVFGDRLMIHLVAKNLLENAIKLSKSHQKIRIYSEQIDDKLCIHLADSGVSIPQQYLDKIFHFDSRRILESFAKEHGLGINLLVARDFIEKNGGKIWARNVSDIGNVFSFCLPYAGNFEGDKDFEMLFVD